MQTPQSCAASKPKGQVWHCTPSHSLRQLQVHPVLLLPVTPVAWPLQLAAVVHVRWHPGYVSYPEAQLPQSLALLKFDGQVAHEGPVHELRQVQTHAPSTPDTPVAWLSQSCVLVHTRLHAG